MERLKLFGHITEMERLKLCGHITEMERFKLFGHIIEMDCLKRFCLKGLMYCLMNSDQFQNCSYDNRNRLSHNDLVDNPLDCLLVVT